MAASDYVPIIFKNRLHLAGRPQMGSRRSADPDLALGADATLSVYPNASMAIWESKKLVSFGKGL